MVTEFILVGFTGGLSLRISLFLVLLLVYMVTLVGNGIMMFLIFIERGLHTPMYLFLLNLSILETVNISNVIPLMLVQILSLHKSISLSNCFTQSFVYVYLSANAFVLLSIMSYDRYVAICNPLRYTTIMNDRLCFQLIISTWLVSLFFVLYPTFVVIRLPYCGPNSINHFYCDGLSIIELACSDTGLLRLYNIISSLILLPGSLGMTSVSYILIIATILRIPSANGRRKTFSTCSSHLTMVSICYGSAIFVQVSPSLHPSIEVYKAVSMASTIISPLMNPIVYTFRNKKFKEVLKKRTH
ncbi:olfactory receptor 6X1-like [Ambystoma mexicanum]|uniref:olfactory receptor 6X1-like n=1 Tax=Ambystoma mexicanum TaxID=8296 RepID=UPI0037E9058F